MQRHTFLKLTLAMLAFAGVSFFGVAGVRAMPAPAGVDAANGQRAQAAPTAVAPGTYSGKVTNNTNSGLTIHGNDGDRTVIVQPGAAITRNGKTAAVSDLKNDDDVTMTVAQNGVVQSINATSKKSAGFNPLWLLLLLLLLIPLLLWLLSRRKKEGFVLEQGRTGTTARPTTTNTAKTVNDDFTIEKNQGGTGNQPRP